MAWPENYNSSQSPSSVVLIDPVTGEPYAAGGGDQGGPVQIAGADGATVATQINPIPVTEAQGVIASGPVTLEAATAQTIIGAFPDRRGMMVLNYTDAPVYLAPGTSGTPASGAGSICVPAATAGVPGSFVFPFAPVTGVRAVGASAGGLTVTVW